MAHSQPQPYTGPAITVDVTSAAVSARSPFTVATPSGRPAAAGLRTSARSAKPRAASAATKSAIVVAPRADVTQMTKVELMKELVSRRVKQSSINRRHYGASTELNTIAAAILNAELGYLVDFMDLQTETLTLDPHLASCAVKRFAPLACADWDMTPAQAVEKGDRKWATQIADLVRDSFVRAFASCASARAS